MNPRTAPLLLLLVLWTTAPALAQLSHRGFMIDMSRMKEKDAYYFELVDQLALFGYNALYLHFTDDEGLTIDLASHPELVSDYAMSRETLARLIDHAVANGIDVIPEIEAWGHAGWIIDHHPHLADSTDTRTLEMGNEDVYVLLDAIIDETARLFASSPYIHIGMDEAWYPAVPDVTPELDRHIAAHVIRIADMVRSRGKTPMMWADMVTNRPRVLSELPKDIIMIDWRYWIDETDAETRALREAGFQVVTGPAIMWYEARVHPGPHNWENVRRMTRIAHEMDLMGTVVTAWLPQRYPPGVLPHAIAYGGYLMQRPETPDLEEAMRRFVMDFFGSDDASLVSAFTRIAGIESTRADLFATFWSDPASFAERLTPGNRAKDMAYLNRVSGIGEALRGGRSAIRRGHEAFEHYVLLADLLEYLGRRRTMPAAVQYAVDEAGAERDRGNVGMAVDRLTTMAAEVRALERMRLALIDRLDENWDTYRYPDHPLKDEGGPNSLMWWMKEESHHAYARSALVTWLEDVAAAR